MMQNESHTESSVFTNGKLRVDYAADCAYLNDKELHLTPIEYKLLCLLSKNVGKVLTHTFITQSIWGSWENDVASLRVFMATLRKKLEKEPDSPQYIQTHIGWIQNDEGRMKENLIFIAVLINLKFQHCFLFVRILS